jgi:hypothetical protein
VREAEEPDDNTDYPTFTERIIGRAPLAGQYFVADARRVHQLLIGFLQGENTETWIRSIAKFQDGRKDMTALRRHYAGEGNSTRRIADTKQENYVLYHQSHTIRLTQQDVNSIHMPTPAHSELTLFRYILQDEYAMSHHTMPAPTVQSATSKLSQRQQHTPIRKADRHSSLSSMKDCGSETSCQTPYSIPTNCDTPA